MWKFFLPETNILGVSVGSATPSLSPVQTKINPPIPTNTPVQASIPTKIPTAVPTATPNSVPTNVPTKESTIMPTATPTSPPVFISPEPQPTGAIIYADIATVPIDAYKTPQTIQSQTISPVPTVQQTQLVIQNGQFISVPVTPAVEENKNLKFQPLIVETVNNAGGSTGSVQIISNDTPVTIENKNNQLAMNVTVQNGTTQQLAQDTFQQLSERLQEDNINIYAAGTSDILIKDSAVAAVTNLPLSVNKSNKIFVNTQELTVLPTDMMELLNDSNIVNTVQGNTTNLGQVKQLIKLINYNNELAYEIQGCKKEFFLALFPTDICMTVIASIKNANNPDYKVQSPIDRVLQPIKDLLVTKNMDKDSIVLHISENPVYRILDILSL